MKSKIKNRCGRILLNSHVKSKLLWIYFILIVLPMGYFTIFTFTRVSNVLEEQTLTVAQKNFEDIYMATERTMSELDSVLEILTQDELVYQISSHNPMDYPVIQQYIKTQQISSSFYNLQKISSSDNIRIYVDNDFIYSQENRYIFSLDSILESNWYKTLINSKQNSMWFSPDDFYDQPDYEQKWFSSMRIIYNPDSVLEPLAILRVDILADSLNEVFHATPVTDNGNVVLLKGDIPLLYTGENISTINSHHKFPQFINSLHDRWEIVNFEHGKSYVRTKEITPSGWTIATAIPFDDVFKVSRSLGSDMLFTMVAVGILAYILAYAISNSSILRITTLAQSMKLVKTGD
ncbi:MAG: cache domain-containing protein, partial [Oscillospiraceae bacterium]